MPHDEAVAGPSGFAYPLRCAVHTDDFDFHLPPELIAQAPLPERDASRLLHARGDTLHHRVFRELPSLLRRGDLLVFNDSRVIPARLLGRKVGTGGRAELLLVRPAADVETEAALKARAEGTVWLCLGQSSKGFRPGMRLEFDGGLEAEVEASLGGGEYRVRFTSPLSTLEDAIARAGQLPLPPYIERAPEAADAERYQTVYARTPGSIAAPTAGLHFTEATFAALDAAGVDRAFVTLEVGPGTFLPVREGPVAEHTMHAERASVGEATAARVREAKRAGRRVIAVGTTVVRTLESFADEAEVLRAGATETALFITPGFTFRVVDALVTNFHLPKSTLVMLVSAFLGRERTLAAYAEAVRERYRFFSYGDAMFIERPTP
jgi:S-adenosylmethionine:tRNA ribosyltransferase-isomerase